MSVLNLVVPRLIVHGTLLVIYLEMGTHERKICCSNKNSPSCSVVLAVTSSSMKELYLYTIRRLCTLCDITAAFAPYRCVLFHSRLLLSSTSSIYIYSMDVAMIMMGKEEAMLSDYLIISAIN